MAQRAYTVTGMSCAHCVQSVSREVGKIDGVDRVDVDLVSGTVTVTGAGFGDEQIEAAVDVAGYQVTSA